MFAGAEPTMRSDFVELCENINKLGFEGISLISNGLKFKNHEFARQCFAAGLRDMCFGLNHISYQDPMVHKKQLIALDNLIDIGYHIGYVGYTIESLEHVEDILQEIKLLDSASIDHFRIRCGSFIGRSNDQHRSYLSDLVTKVVSVLGTQVRRGFYDDNPYHVMLEWGKIKLRLIQWPDVTNIDLEELSTGPWCNFVKGPITNFVHQVILRDAFKNKKLLVQDYAPAKYHYRVQSTHHHYHWRRKWLGPEKRSSLDDMLLDASIELNKNEDRNRCKL